jgi:hypothetical protein
VTARCVTAAGVPSGRMAATRVSAAGVAAPRMPAAAVTAPLGGENTRRCQTTGDREHSPDACDLHGHSLTDSLLLSALKRVVIYLALHGI